MATCSVDGCETRAVARGYCTKHWDRWRKHGDPSVVLKSGPPARTCSEPGCSGKHVGQGLCAKHYSRLKRHGTTTPTLRRPNGSGSLHSGYLKVRAAGHPLATRNGFVYAHRIALYDAIGPGDHKCFNCGTSVSWDKSFPRSMKGLVVDHIDHDRLNNAPANLRASCGPCNMLRL